MKKDIGKENLKRQVKEEVTNMFESALDYAQVACPTPDVFKVLRGKILRVGNNCIRNLHSKIEHYNIEKKVTSEDVIEVRR
jgi:hypothetical protein